MTDSGPLFDSREFRSVMGQFCTGVTIVATTTPDGRPVGFACQSFAALSLDPPLVCFMPTRGAGAWQAIQASGDRFCVVQCDRSWGAGEPV